MEYKGETFEERRKDWIKKVNEALNLSKAYEFTSGEKIETEEPKIIKEKAHYYD